MDDSDELETDQGAVDATALGYCPYCGEENELSVDPGGGPHQRYVEDCHVCCRPWHVDLRFDRSGRAWIELRSLDE